MLFVMVNFRKVEDDVLNDIVENLPDIISMALSYDLPTGSLESKDVEVMVREVGKRDITGYDLGIIIDVIEPHHYFHMWYLGSRCID